MKQIYNFTGRTKTAITPMIGIDIVNKLNYKLKGQFFIKSRDYAVDMKSVLGLLSLALQEGDMITVSAIVDVEDFVVLRDFLKTFMEIVMTENTEAIDDKME
jgi:phosphotransferase system HPr-like phosphotransfer protein